MMQSILFALLSYVGWGVGDVFGVMVSKKIGGYSSILFSFSLRAIIFAFFLPFAFPLISHISPVLLFLCLLLAIIYLLGSVFFFEACNNISVSLVGAIGGAYAAPTIFLSVLFLHESLRLVQVVAISIIIAGVIISSVKKNLPKNKKKTFFKGISFAILSTLIWGIFFAFVKIPIKQIGWFWPMYIVYLLSPVISLIMKTKHVPITSPATKKVVFPLIIYTLLASIGNFAYNLGVTRGFASIVAPISGAYPTIFVLLSFFLFKDKLARHQLFGIVLSLVGIVWLSFVSKL